MGELRHAACGSRKIGSNRNAGDWDWPYRCFNCEPATDEERPSLPRYLQYPEDPPPPPSRWQRLRRRLARNVLDNLAGT